MVRRQWSKRWSWASRGRCVPRGRLAWLVLPSTATGQIQGLESTALRLEVNTSTYSYKVIDKSTGSTLLTQAQTAFNVSGTQRIAQSATLTNSTANSLSFNLNLPSVGPAQA